jgi:hypothetical protein
MEYNISIQTLDAYANAMQADDETKVEFEKRRKKMRGLSFFLVNIEDMIKREKLIIQSPFFAIENNKTTQNVFGLISKFIIHHEKN